MRTVLAVALALALGASSLQAAEWAELAKESSVPVTPPAWRGAAPPREQMDEWRGPEAARLVKLATDLEGFALDHLDSADSVQAREKESEALYSAARLGHEGAESALSVLDQVRLTDTRISEDQRLAIRIRQVDEAGRLKFHESAEAGQKAYLEGCRALASEFPKHPEPWGMLIQMADPDRLALSRLILDEVRDHTPLPELRTWAEAVRRKLDNLGKPLELKYTTLEGQGADLSAWRGRVVLLDFWGIENVPARNQLPALQRLYEQYHAKGLEILGLSMDSDPAAVGAFARERHLPWPQACDGRSLQGEIPARFGIRSLPALWLVDRRGVLRDLKGATNIEDKVQLLLDEKG